MSCEQRGCMTKHANISVKLSIPSVPPEKSHKKCVKMRAFA